VIFQSVVISLRTFNLDFIILDLVHNAYFRFRGNIIFRFMYSDYTNSIDPHPIMTIFLVIWLSVIFFFMDGLVFTMIDSLH
jgi:hypothetical protein